MFLKLVVEVEVDEATGKVDIIEVWSAHDLGRAINPGAVEGQIRASSVRKIGEIIDKHPDEALAILRTWIYEE